MAIPIKRQEVLNNLIRFKENLLSRRENKIEPLFAKRTYTAVINRSTGEIRFAEKVEEGDWQEIRLVVEDQKGTVHFQATNPKGEDLKPADLDPLAISILFETLDALNELASQYRPSAETPPEKEVLQHIAVLRVASAQESIESIQGWAGPLTRLQAEEKLFGRPIGTYLLREGEWAGVAAKAFAEANTMQVNAYILTFVEEVEKISDRLLLQTPRGWTIACDNSDLQSPVYEYRPSLSALLRGDERFKTPLEAP